MATSTILTIIGVLLLIALAFFIYYKVKKEVDYIKDLRQLDLKSKGFTEMPAVPFSIPDILDTVVQLGLRTEENKMAKYGLSNLFTLGRKP